MPAIQRYEVTATTVAGLGLCTAYLPSPGVAKKESSRALPSSLTQGSPIQADLTSSERNL